MTIVRRGRREPGIEIAIAARVGTIWVTDREPGIRLLFGELLPEAELIAPDQLVALLATARRPAALVIDGTQLLDLPDRSRIELLRLPRVLVCTGRSLISLPTSLIESHGVTVLAKPFCIDDLEAAIAWLLGRDGIRAS